MKRLVYSFLFRLLILVRQPCQKNDGEENQAKAHDLHPSELTIKKQHTQDRCQNRLRYGQHTSQRGLNEP